jgi:hypothetical protein
MGHRRIGGSKIRTADRVDNDIRAMPVRLIAHRRSNILGRRIDHPDIHEIRSRKPLLAPGNPEDARSVQRGNLRRRLTDLSVHRHDEHHLTRPRRSGAAKCGRRRDEWNPERPCLCQ